jgi:hypothetical protein
VTLHYFLPDNGDTIDADYDFDRESHSPDRETRNDSYCHEVLERPYDGMLISYATMRNGVHSAPARRRLLRSGVREFFRAPDWLRVMGDCGAFSYVKAEVPPYTVAEIVDFFATTRVDFGLSLDHIVPGYSDIEPLLGPDHEQQRRYDLTIALASDFLAAAKPHKFTPVGVVQGWSPDSYTRAAADLQRMGYSYLALGGLVKLQTAQINTILAAIDKVRLPSTRLHLLGVTRPGNVAEWVNRGVASIDSTSPLRRSWMDARANYWIDGETYCALRIPPSISPRIKNRVSSGELNGDHARALEEAALATVAAYAQGNGSARSALAALLAYGEVHSPDDKPTATASRATDYQRTLDARPWERCKCAVCSRLGHHVIVMRGAERNRARGFHNVGRFFAGLCRESGEPDLVLVGCGKGKRETASRASAMYTGSLFKAHSTLAGRYRAPTRILSGLHGILDPSTVIEPYKRTMVGASKAERRAWNEMVAAQLAELVPAGGRVVALAGSDYLDWVSDVPGITVELPLAGMTMGARLAAVNPEPPKVEREVRTGPPIAWDFFFTTSRSSVKASEFDATWDREGAYFVKLTLPDDTPLEEAIAAARETGLFGKGSGRSGVFEVQNDLGVYSHPRGFVNLQAIKPDSVVFRTWAQVEASEAA